MANTKISEATLTVPTGTDKIPLARVGDTVARYATVEGITGGVLNVRSYGAVGDGVTDDTAAITAAITHLPSGYGVVGTNIVLYFPRGTYLISDTIDLKSRYRCRIEGDEAIIQAKTGIDFSGKCLVNFSGSAYTIIRGMQFVSALAVNKPTACVIYGRNSGGSGGDIHFEDCIFSGDCTVASLLFAQGDTSSFRRCRINSNGTAPALIMTSYNDSGLLDYTSSTATLCRFENCYIFSYEVTNPKIIVMQGLIQRTLFDTCFIFLPGNTIAVSVEDSAGAPLNEVANLTFLNTSIEGGAAGALWINQHNTTGISGLNIIGGSWSANSTYVINIDSLGATEGLSYVSIPSQIGLSYPSSVKLLHLTAGTIKWSYIACGSEDIYTEAGTNLIRNFIFHVGGLYDLGSGTVAYNYIQGYGGDVGVNNIGYETYAAPNGEAVPYAAGGIIIFSNTVPTTVTNLNKVNANNPVVHCIFTNSNTTLTGNFGGGHIYLSGNDNWNPPAGATLTLVYYNGDWYEVGRMDPT